MVDTNSLIYLLKNDLQLAQLLDRYRVYISFITELELLSFPKISSNEINILEELIDKCFVIQYSQDLKNNIILLKRKYSLKIPDAIIAATAYSYFIPLLTGDKNFSRIKEIEVSIYSIS